MRKLYLYLTVICFITVIASVLLYTTNKEHYLNLSFYSIDNTVDSETEYTNKLPSCIEVIGANIEDEKDALMITDKQDITSVLNYLNNLRLVPVAGYFDKSQRVFVIKELKQQGYDFIRGNNENLLLRFYDENHTELGNIKIYNDKYICDPNYNAYKVYDNTISIISDLKKLCQK